MEVSHSDQRGRWSDELLEDIPHILVDNIHMPVRVDLQGQHRACCSPLLSGAELQWKPLRPTVTTSRQAPTALQLNAGTNHYRYCDSNISTVYVVGWRHQATD